MAYGLRVVRTGAFVDTTRDPILTMLSIGVEKLYKLTLGVSALDKNGAWPTQSTMRDKYRHNLLIMHKAVMDDLRKRTEDKSQYVRRIFAEVEEDAVISPILEALDMYGRMGRFYYLDMLGEAPQTWESPDAYWDRIEATALRDPQLSLKESLAITAMTDSALWDDLRASLNARVANSIENLWTVIAVAGRNHAFGEAGRVLGFEVHPESVGRQ